MNAITELYDELVNRGHQLEVAGDRLRIIPQIHDAELIERLRQAKPAFLKAASIPGWPDSLPVPGWLVELVAGFPDGTITQARSQTCHDIGCGFHAAVEWNDTDGATRWSCPRCGLTSKDPDLIGPGPHTRHVTAIERLFNLPEVNQ